MSVSQILNKFVSNTNHRIYNKDLFENAFLEFIKNKYLSIKLDDVIKDYRLGMQHTHVLNHILNIQNF